MPPLRLKTFNLVCPGVHCLGDQLTNPQQISQNWKTGSTMPRFVKMSMNELAAPPATTGARQPFETAPKMLCVALSSLLSDTS
jgi:hypothetical protein